MNQKSSLREVRQFVSGGLTANKKELPSAAYGFVLDNDANAFFTAAENFSQPQDSEPFSQRADFACGLAVGSGTFAGVNAVGGLTG